ncbi:MAG: hypothetical protein U0175_06610 [Caldilineaceae bacterium]
MASLIALIGQFAPYIYAVCGLVALFQMYRAWQVRQERRQAVFSYEREKAIRELYSIFFTAIILLFVMAGTYFTSTTLKNAVASSLEEGGTTSEFAFFLTPTSTPLPSTPTNTPEATATDIIFTLPGIDTPVATDSNVPTATPAASGAKEATPTPDSAPPTATSAPAPVVVAPSASCGDQRAMISTPGNGQAVSGLVSVIGTASNDQFQFYKLEIAPGSDVDDGYTYLGGGQDQVLNGVLWSFDARTYAAGAWTIRLTVVDHTGNWIEPRCKVTINVN